MTRVVSQQERSSVYLVEIDRHDPRRGRVYDRPREILHPEIYLDSIAARGGWVAFEGSDEEREAIEHELAARLDL